MFESVDSVGTKETLLSLRVLKSGVSSRQKINFYTIQKSMLLTAVLNYLLCNIPMVPKMFAVAYDRFAFVCDMCRNQSMVPRFYYSDACTYERQEDAQT